MRHASYLVWRSKKKQNPKKAGAGGLSIMLVIIRGKDNEHISWWDNGARISRMMQTPGSALFPIKASHQILEPLLLFNFFFSQGAE